MYQSGPVSSSASPSLLGLDILEDDNKDDTFHHLYFWPGHLLSDVLIPLMDGLAVWIGAVTTAASIDQRVAVSRDGALNLSRTSSSAKSMNDKGTVIGHIRWRHGPPQEGSNRSVNLFLLLNILY